MQIISKQKDYYDYMQRYGLDPTIVYRRTYDEFDLKDEFQKHSKNLTVFERTCITNEIETLKKETFNFRYSSCSIHVQYIVVCGVPYLNLKVSLPPKHYNYFTAYQDEELYFLNLADVLVFLKKKLDKKEFKQVLNKIDSPYYFDKERKSDRHYLENLSKNLPKLPAITFLIKEPIFIIKQDRTNVFHIETNIILRKRHFANIMDATTIFQKISAWLSCIKEVPMAQISDENMRDKKGFDKMSFKKSPTKKKT